mmetsp:Transcript_488/g.1507  ORF Transcript_488/g.1507 Transcript_488/m.1507 type:complete len:130 (+) Transcript_488:1-390(+)
MRSLEEEKDAEFARTSSEPFRPACRQARRSLRGERLLNRPRVATAPDLEKLGLEDTGVVPTPPDVRPLDVNAMRSKHRHRNLFRGGMEFFRSKFERTCKADKPGSGAPTRAEGNQPRAFEAHGDPELLL